MALSINLLVFRDASAVAAHVGCRRFRELILAKRIPFARLPLWRWPCPLAGQALDAHSSSSRPQRSTETLLRGLRRPSPKPLALVAAMLELPSAKSVARFGKPCELRLAEALVSPCALVPVSQCAGMSGRVRPRFLAIKSSRPKSCSAASSLWARQRMRIFSAVAGPPLAKGRS